tara:strand:+ start:116 stop:715 length:600 start_codon:yes stop_codon:yes gene_type:complete
VIAAGVVWMCGRGSKPGEGGILPACKVTKEIAEARNIPEDEDSIFLNRNKEAANTSELLDFIAELRKIIGKPIVIKTTLGDPAWVEEFCEEVTERDERAAPGFLTMDRSEGGSGAALMMLMDWAALSIRIALPATVKALKKYSLKKRIRIIASGQLVTSGDVACALAAGADYVVSARALYLPLAVYKPRAAIPTLAPAV